MEPVRDIAEDAASTDPDVGLRSVAALRALTERLEILQVDNARRLGWSWQQIAERLGVTKAALSYHFKSKEDIVRSFTEDYRAELEAVIAWGAAQPPTPATRTEILARYADIVSRRLAVIRFMEQNQAAMHTLMSDGAQRKKLFREQFTTLSDLLTPPGATLPERVRAAMSVICIGMSSLLFQREAASPAELHDAVLGVACDLANAPAA